MTAISTVPVRNRQARDTVAACQSVGAHRGQGAGRVVVDSHLDQFGAQPGQQRGRPVQGHDRALVHHRDAVT